MKKLTIESLDPRFAGYEHLTHDERLDRIFGYIDALHRIANHSCPYALLMLAAMGEGTDFDNLTRFTGLPPEFVAEVADRMTAAGFWASDGSVDYEFLTARPGHHWKCSFTIHVLVAQGLLEWTGKKENGRKVYQPTETGRRLYAERKLGN